jgi:hypothetical protein
MAIAQGESIDSIMAKRFRIRKQFIGAASAVVLVAPAMAAHADPLTEAFTQGRPLIDIRLRYEGVDQYGFAKNADALTVRARLGYQTGDWNGFSALFEFDQISIPGSDDFNSTRNGKTAYPVVADPSMTALDRLQVSYKSDFDTVATLGRQRIILDDARFVGNVGWRQHEQTYDAISVVNKSIPDLTLTYAYADRVNRVFGPENAAVAAQVGYFNGNIHLINAAYTGIDDLKLVGYAYLLDLDNNGPSAALAKNLSTATYGVRGQFTHSLGHGIAGKLTGAYAYETDYARNPGSFALDYYLAEASLSYKGLCGLAGYESLGSNGVTGFSTPLATLHAFNGWADQFLTTPAKGLDDLYFKAAYTLEDVPVFSQIAAVAMYHTFRTEVAHIDYGSEWDGSLDLAMDKNLAFQIAYADYISSGVAATPADKRILWLSANYKY